MSATETDVIVIGAGLAGLTAAWRLRQAGIAVRVIEADSVPGGRVRTVRHGGYQFDAGADALSSGYVEYLALLRELGLEARLQPLPAVVGVVRHGRVIYADASRLWSLLTTPALSLGAKLRLGLGYRKLSALWCNTPLDQLYRLGVLDSEGQGARANSEKIFGKEVTEYVIDPLLRTVNGSGVDASSWVDVVIAFGLCSQQTFCLRGGQDVLPRALAERLDVRYGCRATGIVERDGRVVVSYADDQGRDQKVTAQGCVLATMYHTGSALYPPLAEISRDYARRLQHMRLGKVQLGYQARTDTGAYVVQVPGVEDPDVMLVFLDHNKCDDRAPAGHSIVSVFTGTDVADKYLPRSDAALIAWARQKAENWFPELAGHYDTGTVTRWPVMGPAATPGYYGRAAAVLERLPRQARVQIACDMFSKTSQEAAAAWGATAARNLIELLG